MKIRIKRAVSLLLVLCLCWSLMPTYVNAASNITICGVDIGIAAGSYMQFTTSDGTNSNSGSYYNGYYLAASQCFGFARWCQYKLFGYTSYSNSRGFYKISVDGVSDIAAGGLTTTNLKTLITAAKPGAHLRTHENSSGVAHSMVITEVTDSGFSIAQCNGSNNNEYASWKQNYVGTYTYTWSSYVSSTYGSRGIDYIEMPSDYPYTGQTPANLGTEFTGVILNTNAWKPIGVDSDGFVHLETEVGASHQLWKFIRQDDGSYTISSAKTGKLLEMYCGDTTAGNPVAAVSDDWGGNYQRWYLYPQGNGYVLLSKHFSDLNLVMDLTDNNSADGTAIITYPRNNSNAQIWSIYTGSESQLSGPALTVTAGDSVTATKFTWGEVYGESRYDLKIWKGNLWEGDAYHIEWGAKSGFSMQLPAGTYNAYVDGVNYFDTIMGNSVTFTVKEHSHSYSSVVTNPTCTAQGYTTYTCKTCGYSYKGNYTSALGHNYSYKVSTAPTVSATGKLTGTCSRCSGTTTVTLPKLNTTDYTYQVTKAATCEAAGTGRYTWKTTIYGTFYFDVTIAKTGHSYSAVVTAPTCTAQGYTTHTCSGCGDSYKDSYTAALGHNYSYTLSTAPTVSATGKLTGTCSRCSGTTTVTLPVLNTTDYHYQIVAAADCTTEGVGRYTWNTTTYGNYSFDVTIPQTGHSYGAVVTDPTCTEGGYTTYTCTLCGDSYEDDHTDPLGHNYQFIVTEATCTEQGYTTHTCVVCSDSYVDAYTDPMGHDYQNGACVHCGEAEPEAPLSGSCGENLTWSLSDAGTLTISGTGAMYDYSDGSQPWYAYSDRIIHVVMNEGVTSIGAYAFYECTGIADISIPYGVTVIGMHALYRCSGITEVTIPSSVERINYGAFWGASSLCEVTFEGDYPVIDDNAFLGVTATAYYPDNNSTWVPAQMKEVSAWITWIAYDPTFVARGFCGESTNWKLATDGTLWISGTGAMAADSIGWSTYADRIDKVVFGSGITVICDSAFAGCVNVTEIAFEGDVPAIADDAFEGITATAYYPKDNSTWMDDSMQNYGGTLTWSRYVPGAVDSGECGEDLFWVLSKEGVLTISGTGAMYDYAMITTLISPDSMAKLNYAPWCLYTYTIKAVEVEQGVTTIGNNAFYSYYYNVTEVNLPETLTSIGECAFHSTGITTMSIPDGVTSIGYMAFCGCDDLMSIVLPDSVTSIGSYAFRSCSALKEINLPKGLTSIDSYTFSGCDSLYEIVIPDAVQSIGYRAFNSCASLDRLELPAGLTKLGNDVFGGLTELVFTGNAPVFSSNTFTGDTLKVYYPANDDSWTSDVLQQYGGTITWIPYGDGVITITKQPENFVGSVNDEAIFTVEATGNGLRYEWFYSNNDGATWVKTYSSGYQTNSLTPVLRAYRDGNLYKCVITDASGYSVTSEVASMSVKASDIVIVTQPQTIENAILGQLYQFTVEATGDNLTYRWQVSSDGGKTWEESWNQGYNSATLNVRMNANRDGNQYRCVVTSGLKIVLISDAATLDLQDPSAEIISQSGNVAVTAGKTAAFSVEADGMDLTYLWYRSNDKGATWAQTFLPGYNTDTLSFVATTNRTAMYMCKVTDGSGRAIWSSPVKLQILSAELQILTQPSDVTCAAGETATFKVEAQGDTLKYQWYASSDNGATWTASYMTGYNTNELSFVVNTSRAAKLYKCVITDAAGNTVETDSVSVAIAG